MQEKVRSCSQVYKIKDNTSKINCFGHLPDNLEEQMMSPCKEDVCTNSIFKTRGHQLTPGGRTRCLCSQLPPQRTCQIQLMEKCNGTHQLGNPTRAIRAPILVPAKSLPSNARKDLLRLLQKSTSNASGNKTLTYNPIHVPFILHPNTNPPKCYL